MSDPEDIWAGILSRAPETIRETWRSLTPEERNVVYAHLQRMVSEEGWSEPQRISAQAALDALHSMKNDD